MTGSARPQASPRACDRFASALAVADALLFEGYLLYPYRRSAGKNSVRWQFGVLAPRPWVEQHAIPDPGISGAAESWYQQASALLEASDGAQLHIRLRFLQLQRRQISRVTEGGDVQAVDELDCGGTRLLTFDEGVPREVDASFNLEDLMAAERAIPVAIPAGSATEPVLHEGREVARITRSFRPLSGRLRVRAERAAAPFRLVRLTLRVENAEEPADVEASRDAVLASAMLATHLLAAVDDVRGGRFLSLLEPPEWAAAAAAQCRNEHTFPVLAGADPHRDRAEILVCSPILLYDHPAVAPESPGDLHDAAEIDEILSLRTLTLTENEKQEARATDPRAAAIVDRVDAMPPELLERLHGAVRALHPHRPAPDPDTITVAGRPVTRGSRVRLRPRRSGTDAQDMFLAGRSATVQEVLHDVDGSVFVAVTVDDDPAAEVLEEYGRFFQFPPDELEPLQREPAP